MILSFKGKAAEALYRGKRVAGIHPDVAKQAVKKLFMLDTVERVQDLRGPPGNRLRHLQETEPGNSQFV